MKYFYFLKGFIYALLLKLFPSLGYQGVVNTQITIYKRLKNKYPEASENDLLNSLIVSRIQAPPRVAPSQEELAHYESIMQKSDKILADVIWAIVEYEFILSREAQLLSQFDQMDYSRKTTLKEMSKQKRNWRQYIQQRIKVKLG